MFNFFSNKHYLAEELKSCVERIPKDLKTWEKEMARIGKIKTKNKKDLMYHRKQIWEYNGMYKYYEGKLFAYLYVLENLGEYKFVEKYRKEKGILLDHKANRFIQTKKW